MVLQYGRVSGGLLIRLSLGSNSQLSFQGLSGYSAEYLGVGGGEVGKGDMGGEGGAKGGKASWRSISFFNTLPSSLPPFLPPFLPAFLTEMYKNGFWGKSGCRAAERSPWSHQEYTSSLMSRMVV